MINHLSLISDLGPNADLLLESDLWLDNCRKRLATELSIRAAEFDAVLKAIKYKASIQQNNSVAARIIERDEYGNAIDISIEIMPISKALKILNNAHNDIADIANEAAQRHTWNLDGYDIETIESSNIPKAG